MKLKTILLVQLCVYVAVPTKEAEAASSHDPEMPTADIVFLLDSTFSIGRENWDGVKDLVKNVANQVNYGPDETRIATIRYSRQATQVIGLDDFSNKQDMFDALDAVEFKPGGGQVHKALNVLQNTFKEPRQHAARIGVLVVDEKSHNTPATLAAAEKLNQEGIKMIVIGVKRRRFDMDELVGISSGKSRVILIDDIRELNQPEVLGQLTDIIRADANEAKQVEEEVKSGDAIWTDWFEFTTCSGTCGEEALKESHRYCVDRETKDDRYDCVGEDVKNESCGLPPCPSSGDIQGPLEEQQKEVEPVMAQVSWTEWADWSACTEWTERTTRQRTCTNDMATSESDKCQEQHFGEVKDCGLEPCPMEINAEWTGSHAGTTTPGTDLWNEWTSWSSCSMWCEKIRTRTFQQPSIDAGMQDCEEDKQYIRCRGGACSLP